MKIKSTYLLLMRLQKVPPCVVRAVNGGNRWSRLGHATLKIRRRRGKRRKGQVKKTDKNVIFHTMAEKGKDGTTVDCTHLNDLHKYWLQIVVIWILCGCTTCSTSNFSFITLKDGPIQQASTIVLPWNRNRNRIAMAVERRQVRVRICSLGVAAAHPSK